MSRVRAARAALAALIGLLAWFAPPPAHASTEEFSTFDVLREEEDDESLLDHTLTRFPDDWRDEWEGSANAFRTAQGCLTAGEWFQVHDLKVRSNTGRHSWLDLQMLTNHDNRSDYEWLQFQFRFGLPYAPGKWGIRFRPAYDKSQHDFAALWDSGTDSSRVQVQAVLTIEDAFNKLWEFRQTRVGNRAEPYERHPFEPALRVAWRHGDAALPPSRRPSRFDLAHGARVEASGEWFTPARQRLEEFTGEVLERSTLWGGKGAAQAEARAGRWGVEARFENVQARSGRMVVATGVDGLSYRRRWSTELAASARLSSRWSAEARWIYQDRTLAWRPLGSDGEFRCVERLPMTQLFWRPSRDWRTRFGLMRDRASVAERGVLPGRGYGARFETRAFVGLEARFGRVVVQGVECVELDREPYEVSFHHDKGFLHLLTTF